MSKTLNVKGTPAVAVQRSVRPQCEGYHRHGGAFTLGPVTWQRCKEPAIVMLTMMQDGRKVKLPGCAACWKTATETKGTEVLKATPIAA
jgi:hypothetical protein